MKRFFVAVAAFMLLAGGIANGEGQTLRYIEADGPIGDALPEVVAECPRGFHVVGGGVVRVPQGPASGIPWDGPDANSRRDDGWLGLPADYESLENKPGGTLHVHAVCLRP